MAKTGENGVTPLIHPEHHLITFVPVGFGASFTDPSYHIPAFYEVWARWAEDGRADYWRECARVSREYLHKAIHPKTGLTLITAITTARYSTAVELLEMLSV